MKVGTSAELKRAFGKGFKITVLISNKHFDKVQLVKDKVLDMIPGSNLYAQSGCNLLFQLPFEQEDIINQ